MKLCECGKLIYKVSKRCKSCSNKYRTFKWSEESKNKIKNENNNHWFGDKVGYNGIHSWIKRRLKKPELCQNCNIKKVYDLANISQQYKRNLNDWEWLCRTCHMIKDGRLDKLHQNRKINVNL